MTKIGMIFECGPNGPDQKVCEHLARRLVPNVYIEPATLDNKPKLIEGCGKVAATLLAHGCERVLIIWDLFPAWRSHNECPCRHEDREAIFRSLIREHIDPCHVHLICIEEELETWLLADGRALSQVLSRRTHSVTVKDRKAPESVHNPKPYLTRLFQQHLGHRYSDLIHAEQIIRALPDLNKIRRIDTFIRFARKVTGRETWPE